MTVMSCIQCFRLLHHFVKKYFLMHKSVMCGSRKYPYPSPPWKVTGNPEGEGASKAKISEGNGGSWEALLPEGEET